MKTTVIQILIDEYQLNDRLAKYVADEYWAETSDEVLENHTDEYLATEAYWSIAMNIVKGYN